MSKSRLKWVPAVLVVVMLLPLLSQTVRGKLEWRAKRYFLTAKAMWLRTEAPNVAWEETSPEQVGLSSQALDELRDDLERRGSTSFLVARHGRLAYEWYNAVTYPNAQLGLAAAAKPLIGTWVLLLSADEGHVELDDLAKQYIEEWADDPLRSKITLRQLASHTSGIQNVKFNREDGHAEAWKSRYEQNRGLRFEMAIRDVPIVHEPGERDMYTGVAYYALAYALMKARSGIDADSHDGYLAKRLMRPLGIPDEAWYLSYGESHDYDDMRLQAIGSGASITARGAARIASLMLSRGEWDGRQLIAARWFPELVRRTARIPHDESLGQGRPSLAMGWNSNWNAFFPSLPSDAILAVGRKQQIVLVIPSLELIAVRTGQYLGADGTNPHRDLEEYFNAPLMRCLAKPH